MDRRCSPRASHPVPPRGGDFATVAYASGHRSGCRPPVQRRTDLRDDRVLARGEVFPGHVEHLPPPTRERVAARKVSVPGQPSRVKPVAVRFDGHFRFGVGEIDSCKEPAPLSNLPLRSRIGKSGLLEKPPHTRLEEARRRSPISPSLPDEFSQNVGPWASPVTKAQCGPAQSGHRREVPPEGVVECTFDRIGIQHTTQVRPVFGLVWSPGSGRGSSRRRDQAWRPGGA